MGNRKTPSEIKRQLRKEAGFGCCVCGHPIIQYHHIIPWSQEEHFRIKDMMCLCPNHHDEATQGAMTMEEQYDYKARPFNIQEGCVQGRLKVDYIEPIVRMGNCNFVGEGSYLTVDGHWLVALRVEEGALVISVRLYDALGNRILEVIDNEWISTNELPWDILASYQYLKIRQKKHKVSLEINTKECPIFLKGQIEYKGQMFKFTPHRFFFNGVVKELSFIGVSIIGGGLNVSFTKKTLEIKPLAEGQNIRMIGTIDVDKVLGELEKKVTE